VSLVEEFYNIEDHEVRKLAEGGNAYWVRVRDFWWSIKERSVDSITPAQAKWLATIEDSLENEWRPNWMENEGPGLTYPE
jgi:hypothetical protein